MRVAARFRSSLEGSARNLRLLHLSGVASRNVKKSYAKRCTCQVEVCEVATDASDNAEIGPNLTRLNQTFDARLRCSLTGRAHGAVAAVSTDDTVCLALSLPLDRAGSSRAEFRMNVNSEAT
jgi:hypothetical protein